MSQPDWDYQDCLNHLRRLADTLPKAVSEDLLVAQASAQQDLLVAREHLAEIEAEITEIVSLDKKLSNETSRKAGIEKRQLESPDWRANRDQVRQLQANYNKTISDVARAETAIKTGLAQLSAEGRRAELISNYFYHKARLAELEAMRLRAQIAIK